MSEVRKETGEKWWSCDDSGKRMLKLRNIRWSLSCIWFLPYWWWGRGGLLKSLQFSRSVALCDPWTAAHQASLSITNSWSLLTLMSIELVMPSNHLILCHPLFLLPSIFLSIRVFSSESALHITWPKYCSFSFSISPSSEYSRLISFKIDWFDLAVQGDSQESSPTPQFKSMNSLAMSFLYSPTLTSIHDYWKAHSFD